MAADNNDNIDLQQLLPRSRVPQQQGAVTTSGPLPSGEFRSQSLRRHPLVELVFHLPPLPPALGGGRVLIRNVANTFSTPTSTRSWSVVRTPMQGDEGIASLFNLETITGVLCMGRVLAGRGSREWRYSGMRPSYRKLWFCPCK